MPKLKKRVQLQNLSNIRTWIVDNNPFSEYFRLAQIPEIIPGGKSGFLINGSPNLVRTTEVLVELTDVNGNPVFTQPIKNYQEGLARVVSFEVYDDTPPGPAVLTILGELAFDSDGNRVPDEWIGTYNVKWQRTVNIEPTKPNSNVIRLYNRPVLSVSEQLIPFRQTVTGSMIDISSGTITGQYVPANVQLVGDDITNLQRQVSTDGTIITATDPIFVRRASDGTFTALVDGVPFTSSIQRLQSSTTARLPRFITGSDAQPVIRWSTNNYTMSYQQSPTYITSSLNRSFANISLTNLTTFTGDIQRAKFYVRGIDEDQKYELLEDVVLESVQLTVSQSSTGEQVQLGQIIDQPFLDQNWEVGQIENGNSYQTGSVTASYNSTVLIDSVTITGAGTGSIASTYSDVPLIWTGISESIALEADTEYTFECDVVCTKADPDFDARMDVRLYGTNFLGGQSSQLGYLITKLESPAGQSRRTFQNFIFNFTTTAAGLAKLRFAIYGGSWYLSNVKITSARESGFNPDQISVFSSVIGRRFERLQFKAELYDANSNLVPLNIETDPIYFDGGNLVFRGSDTRIDGILTVAPSGSGPTLTTRGFNNIDGVFTLGQAISIGPSIPQVRSATTAFFAGTSSNGPEISVGDKLYGYYDFNLNEFILQIQGTLLIGSGSNFVDIRTLLPRSPRDAQFARLTAQVGDFYDLRGRYSVTAGEVRDQIARMGNYTRERLPVVWQPPVTSPDIDFSYDAYTTSSIILASSCSINLSNSNIGIYNNTLYLDGLLQMTANTASQPFSVIYTSEVVSSWTGYPSTGSAGTEFAGDGGIIVVQTGSFLTNNTINFPIPVPSPRIGDTLYIVTKITINTEASV